MGRRAFRQRDRTSSRTVHDIFKEDVKSQGRRVLRPIHGHVHHGELTRREMRDRFRYIGVADHQYWGNCRRN